MSMEITNNYGNYITGYANAAKKTGSTESKNEEEKGVKTSTVELKTSTHGVTKTAQIKTGFSNVNDYSKYLQEKYSYMNTGKTSMSGIPTTVTVSSAFLKKCMNDPEKAKYLEDAARALELSLSKEDIAYLEEPYQPHRVVGLRTDDDEET